MRWRGRARRRSLASASASRSNASPGGPGAPWGRAARPVLGRRAGPPRGQPRRPLRVARIGVDDPLPRVNPSAIRIPPSAVTATPAGLSSCTAVAGPPSPEKPLLVPATVVGDRSGRRDAPDPVIVGVRDQEAAVASHRHRVRRVEPGVGSWAVVIRQARAGASHGGDDSGWRIAPVATLSVAWHNCSLDSTGTRCHRVQRLPEFTVQATRGGANFLRLRRAGRPATLIARRPCAN